MGSGRGQRLAGPRERTGDLHHQAANLGCLHSDASQRMPSDLTSVGSFAPVNEQSEQQVFGPDVLVPKLTSGLLSVNNDLSGLLGEALEHRPSIPRGPRRMLMFH